MEYTYEYNPDKLVMYGSTETIKIYRSGEKDIWFTVSAVNIFEETKALSDLPIVEIKPTGAMKSSYYISGIHYNDFIGMKYVDLKDYFKTLLPSYVYSDYEYKTGGWTSVEGIPNGSNVIEVIVESWDSVRIYSYWCGYSFSSYAKYILYVDPETGKVIKFLPSYYPGFLTPEKIGE